MTIEALNAFLQPATREIPRPDARERYRGALLGLATGNALGVQIEGASAKSILAYSPEGIRDIDSDEARRDWDDDVAQAIELGECLLPGPLDIDDYLTRLVRWAEESGRGMGFQTQKVLFKVAAGATGTTAAQEVWEQSGRHAAGNGAVMRCAPVAMRWRTDPAQLIEDATNSSLVTHYDQRCVWTTVATCAVIAHALAGTEWDPEELAVAITAADAPDEVADAVRFSATSDLAGLELDEGGSIGYTIRAMNAGLWAHLNADDLEATLLDVINAGGDTDTNGAVAGAVLGAGFGVSAIPERWIERLPNPWALESLADRLFEAAQSNL